MGVNPNLLRRSPLFAELPIADANGLAELASMRWADRGDYLHRQGDDNRPNSHSNLAHASLADHIGRLTPPELRRPSPRLRMESAVSYR